MNPLTPTRLLAAATATSLLVGCSSAASDLAAGDGDALAAAATDDQPAGAGTESGDTVAVALAAGIESHDDPEDQVFDESAVIDVTLEGDSVSADGSGITVDGSVVTITAPGTYRFHGALDDGQLLIDSAEEGTVQLILDGVDVSSTTGSALAVIDADEVVVLVADGSTNHLTDAADYAFPDSETDEPNAALYSSADLTIAGSGSLEITGSYNDGIGAKDGLVIQGVDLVVDAVDDGIRGKDYLLIEGGSITVHAGGDGLKSDNDDTTLGVIELAGGTLTVDADGDGVVANHVTVGGGTLEVVAGGGHTASLATDASAKGLKGSETVTIAGGTITVDAADDGIHANNTVTILGGDLVVASGDDGVHGDANVVIDDGHLVVTASYEGVESEVVTINGGTLDLTASDDGINVAGGADGSGFGGPGGDGTTDSGRGGRGAFSDGGGRPGQAAATGDYHLVINGGEITIDAEGDGLDANGTIEITSGTVVVYGPTAQNNGALDVDGSFVVSGGALLAGGSAGMAEAPDADSPQASLSVWFNGALAAGSTVSVVNGDGDVLAEYTSPKSIESLVYSGPGVVSGSSYQILVDGEVLGSVGA
jgi:hypothetical protein